MGRQPNYEPFIVPVAAIPVSIYSVAVITIFLPGLIISSEASAQAQQTPSTEKSGDLEEAKRLNQEAIKLYQQGKYNEAIPLARRSLSILEKALGPDHPNVATSLNNLAGLYYSQGNYSAAEPLYKPIAIIANWKFSSFESSPGLFQFRQFHKDRSNHPQ
jgi:tetratricopeptide (TPR) repeat protein